ncbi:hypothetical protein HB364_26890 [Pseudoflavitalea sp. X16]|uniref:hypothetical protein n=1 Tax=Paraflavitalea devenefica TaxID=2716334 RepID=UPI0014229F17|nr:hypothetical protein [Paraflavitalea devenefica]NII28737.1 hypothetical protein [Paraflavitalea devenefica]
MIQLLAAKYNRHIAYILLLIFMSSLAPVYGNVGVSRRPYNTNRITDKKRVVNKVHVFGPSAMPGPVTTRKGSAPHKQTTPGVITAIKSADIGGPSQPEMSSFQAAGAGNMVNLFTGDFSYNIPLLDVGGYPVNIFYDGSVSMEQEASWVGLGWNINPGNINRNMRGVPDDFNGKDTLIQIQQMKPNKTWGVNLAGDIEIVGLKTMPDWLSVSIGASLGLSVNNYLGPALDFGLKGGVGIKIAGKAKAEKSGDSTASLKIGAGIGANVNSRAGFTLSPNVSLTATHFVNNGKLTNGLSLGTSYNSRNGIKALQISEQMSFNAKEPKGTLKMSKDKLSGWTTTRDHSSSLSASLASTSISFTKPSYIPALRMPLTNQAWSGHFQLGGAIWGLYGSAEIEVYGQSSSVAAGDVTQRKPMVGYLYYENAQGNPAAVMDFTRLNDKEVTSVTPIISAPQYSYDVFSIQGEGTGGSIRAYRNDHGYVRDNYTGSKDKSLSFGLDIGIPGHIGVNFNTIKTPTTIGEWDQGNLLRAGLGFKKSDTTWENVYFRNPGEISVLHDQQFNKVGGTDLVRFRLGGTKVNPTVEPVLERFSADNKLTGTLNMVATAEPAERKKRTQVTSFLTAFDASKVGLDTAIKNYDNQNILDASKNLVFTNIPRVGGYRKAHHLSQINVTETDGKRYVYGIPVYNIRQKDFTFSIDGETAEDLIPFNPADATPQSGLLGSGSNVDGFLQITETPAYAHSFLLSGLLSPDYVDVTGNGITEDDLGGAVKFNYTKINGVHKWRTPLTSDRKANFNSGNLTYKKDNKGIVSYGERESWYLHSLESKSMIAFFILGDRADGKGALDSLQGINYSDASMKRLARIDLYNKADLKKNGLQNARPVKSVHFQYSYRLCANTPANNNSYSETIDGYEVNTKKGKLTLDKIYFTFNGQSRANKNQYVFYYGSDTSGPNNPAYEFNASDRWGSYKPRSMNPDNMKNADYPYAIQPKTEAATQQVQQQAGAWALKKILLPSGSQLEVQYESDDYAFVQNRRATAMMEIVGFGKDNIPMTNKLYDTYWPTTPGSNGLAGLTDNDRVYVKVPAACSTRTEVYEKYLRTIIPQQVSQLAFKLAVNMPKGVEYVTSYATVADYGVVNTSDTIWIQLNPIEGISPLSLTAVEYLREQLPGQAFPGYDVSESSGMAQIGDMLAGMLDALKSAFKDPFKHLRSKGLAQSVVLARSFVRLNDPDGRKYGGGNRVRKVVLKDNWDKMTNQYGSTYGQEYDYSTTETFLGQTRTVSSGVASYEPGIGGEENPFQSIVQVANKLPLGPTSYGAIEMPVLDAFFPSPIVGYSKVTVRSLNKGVPAAQKKSRSGVGRQVTEFYTAKDFPVYYNHTPFDPSVDKQTHTGSYNAFFYKRAFDSRALSQGFIVATNDMHGKMKSQSSYAENDSTTRINYTENFYRNTGSKGLNEKFDFVYNNLGGEVKQGNMGIDVELMTDTREFTVKSSSLEIQVQVDLFPVIFPFWLPFIWPVFGNSENTYRAVTTTKVISYHAILDSVMVIDKGSQVSTKNLVYDAETGILIVSRTNNEFDKPIYTTNYPAYWAYSGMGPAYKNIDAIYAQVYFIDGKITSGNVPLSAIESGDELFIIDPGSAPTECSGRPVSPDSIKHVWALDKKKNSQSLTSTDPDYIFIDKEGEIYTRNNVTFRIIRSGKRNLLAASLAGVTQMSNPVDPTTHKLLVNNNSKVINASALEYREKWQTDNNVIRKINIQYDPYTCIGTEVIDCNGYLEKRINPYRKGFIGNFRPHRSLVFYGSRMGTTPGTATNLPDNGFLNGFKLYWDFDAYKNLIPDVSNTQWVWNSEVTRFNARGMELETKDALNIYSAAQYGYDKTLPVAVANNGRYHEIAYEGFEDSAYSATLNPVSTNPCIQKHIDFTGIANTQIINTTQAGFEAHTGKYMLGVNHNSTASKTIPVKSTVTDSFTLLFGADVVSTLFATGGTLTQVSALPANAPQFPMQFSTSNLGMSLSTGAHNVVGQIAGSTTHYYLLYKTIQYTKITTPGTYTLSLSTFQTNAEISPPDVFDMSAISITIKKSDSTTVGSFTTYSTNSPLSTGVFLTCDTYIIETLCSVDIQKTYTGVTGFKTLNAGFNYSLNTGTISYMTLATQEGCDYTTPIKATDSMLNPTFSLPSGKKMLFSSWVKESCGNPANGTPCNKSTYTDNSVKLQFNDAGTSTDVTLTPSGPIIDGWQRIEGEFLVPAGATTMNLSFINNAAGTAWYDDIRMHPYNANMKSYVYDPVNLRLTAELDPNNYATFYEYDAEGGLIRTKVETKEGIKTIQETRSFKQKNVTTIQ